MNNLLEDLDADNEEEFVNPTKEKSNLNVNTLNEEEQLLAELEESPLINDLKFENNEQDFGILKEMKDMEDIDSGFEGSNNKIMKLDREDVEPMSINNTPVPLENKNPPLPVQKVKTDTPNEFELDELMDEFEESKNKNPDLALQTQKKESSNEKEDFLDDFNW